MFMRETLLTIPTRVQIFLGMNIPMLPHVIHGRIMLPTHDAHDPILSILQSAETESLPLLLLVRRRVDLVAVDDVVGVVVRDVAVGGRRGFVGFGSLGY